MKTHRQSVRITIGASILLSLLASPLASAQSVPCPNKQWTGTGYVSFRNKEPVSNSWLNERGYTVAATDIRVYASNPAYYTGYECADVTGYICKDKTLPVSITLTWVGVSSGSTVATFDETETAHVSEAPRICPEA